MLDLAESSIDLELVCYLLGGAMAEERRSRHELNLALIRLAEEMRVEFASPTQTAHVRPENAGGVQAPEGQVERRLAAHGT